MCSLFTESERAILISEAMPAAPVSSIKLDQIEGAVLLGAGVYCKTLMPHLAAKRIKPAWIADSNPALWGTKLDGVEIRALDSLQQAGDRLVIVMTHHFRAMLKILESHKVAKWGWFMAIDPVSLNYSFLSSPEKIFDNKFLEKAVTIFQHDQLSLSVLKDALKFRITGNPDYFPRYFGPAYFGISEIADKAYSHFVDCGAFDGDTFKAWLASGFCKSDSATYQAFEPDRLNYQLFDNYLATLSDNQRKVVSLYPYAVGDSPGTISMIHGGLTSSVVSDLESGQSCQIVTIDEFLKNMPVSCIKMDLEGYEMSALNGARNIIETQQPVLMLAVYHKTEDLWNIPVWLDNLGLNYKMILRQHAESFSETVCYAIPDKYWNK